MKVMVGIKEMDTRNAWITPVKIAFWGSLILSVVAYCYEPIISKDSAFYIDLATTYLNEGLSAVLHRYDWPWFSVLIAVTHQLTGLPMEFCAQLLCAFFMAGTCSLSVAIVQRRLPSAGFLACLVVLSMPSFNVFRGDLLREFGFWFFCMLVIWQAQRWEEQPGWFAAVWLQLAIFAAVLFRREALLLFPALILWQAVNLRCRKGWQRLFQLITLPPAGTLLIGAYLLISGNLPEGSTGEFWQRINPEKVFSRFYETSERFSATILEKYSRDEAKIILLFGFLGTILLKFVRMLGPFVAPALFRSSWSDMKKAFSEYRLSCFVWVFYLLTLLLFFVQFNFMNSRYASFLNLLAVPLVTCLLMKFSEEYPRLMRILIVVSLVVMAANVVSLSAKKTHYREAGHWLAKNISRTASVHYDDQRIRYYAGWGYSQEPVVKTNELSPEAIGQYQYFVVEGKADEPWLQDWMRLQHKRILAQFSNKKGATVLVAGE